MPELLIVRLDAILLLLITQPGHIIQQVVVPALTQAQRREAMDTMLVLAVVAIAEVTTMTTVRAVMAGQALTQQRLPTIVAQAMAIANTTLGQERATGAATHRPIVVPAIATVAAEAAINQATSSRLRLTRAKAAGVAIASHSRVTVSPANLAVVLVNLATALLREEVDSPVVVGAVVTLVVADVAHANRN